MVDYRKRVLNLLARVKGLPEGEEQRSMAVIACKLIVEHNMLEEEPSSPPPRQVDPFSDFGSFEDLFKHAVHQQARRREERARTSPREEKAPSNAEVPRKVLLSQPLRCARCTAMISAGGFSCWSAAGAVYHPLCWEMLALEKNRKSWSP